MRQNMTRRQKERAQKMEEAKMSALPLADEKEEVGFSGSENNGM